MIKNLIGAVALATLSFFGAQKASAALVEFQVDSVTASILSTQPISGDPAGELIVNAGASGLGTAVGTQSYNSPPDNSITFGAFRWFGIPNPGQGSPNDTTADSYSVSARIVLKIGGATHEFIQNGVLSNWTVVGNNGNLTNTTPVLTWFAPLIGMPNPQFVVSFNSIFDFVPNEEAQNSMFTTVTVSVVPLPAGILLLGTALLGLFGLSRRRKLAAA